MLSGRKPSENELFASWKVVSCLLSEEPYPPVEGVQFRLEEGGDLVWEVLPSTEQETLPFFSCETFEFDSSFGELKCYGSNVDRIEFKCTIAHSDQLVLSLEKVLKMHCEEVHKEDTDDLSPSSYSLLPAFTEGYFVDVTFTANSGEKVSAHKTILSCLFVDQSWDTIPSFLRDLAPEVLHGLLHYLYTACLPENISEDTAKQLLRISKLNQGIGNLGELCFEFLEATAVKNRIKSLTNDLYSTFEDVLVMVESLTGLSRNCSQTDSQQHHSLDTVKLIDVAKRALKQLATGTLKFVLLCNIFTKQKADLSKEERQDVITHCRARLTCFAELAEKFLIICNRTLSGLSILQKEEIALCLIPEIEEMWLTSTQLGSETHAALERIVQKADTDHKKKNHLPKVGTSLSKTLKNAVHLREVLTLKRFQDKASSSLVFVLQKREDFSVMSEDQKVRTVVKSINKLITEIPEHIHNLHKFPRVLEKKVSWKEWKHFFKVWTSRASLVLRKVLANREVLQPIINRSCDLVKQEEFNRVLMTLGLVRTISTEEDMYCNPTSSKDQKNSSRVESVVTPPSGSENPLANSVTQLLSSGRHADMYCVLDGSLAHESGCPECEMFNKQGSVEIPVHRVILAARCDWFRRALLSGMRESIERRISIPDTSPCLFRKFLWYLYSGVLDTRSLGVEQLTDLLSLSDRYEMDSLKEICQQALHRHVAEDTVLFILGVADQFSASRLKEHCLRFVTSHADDLDQELFEELPCHLKREIQERINQNMPKTVEDVRQAFAASLANFEDDEGDSDDDDVDDLMSHGNSQVERCIEVLKFVLGNSVPRRELVRVTLAADCDPNRALNFYFA